MKKLTLAIIIILGTLVIYFYNNSKHEGAKGPDTLVVHDTTWEVHEKTIVKEVPIVHEIPVNHEVLVTKYQPDTNYNGLKKQYDALVKNYASKRVYKDSIKVGTHGYIQVTDTVSENKLGKRTTKDNFKIPIVKETMTITKYAEPQRQVYVGGGINMRSMSSFSGVEGGLLYKTKKDQIIGAKVGVNVDGSITYGIQSYFKIKLKK
jgi:hypothetical protein